MSAPDEVTYVLSAGQVDDALRRRLAEVEADRDRLREALQAAYDGFVRASRDPGWPYEERKVLEEWVRAELDAALSSSKGEEKADV